MNDLYFILFAASTVFLVICFLMYMRLDDEVPLVFGVFNILFLARYFSIASGASEWIDFDYGVNFSHEPDQILSAAGCLALGAVVLVIAYLISFRAPPDLTDDDELLAAFLHRNRGVLFLGVLVFEALSVIATQRVAADYAQTELISNSYFNLFACAASSFIILLSLMARMLFKTAAMRWVSRGLVVAVAMTTFQSTLRFQFLGWSIPLLAIYTGRWAPMRRLGAWLAGLIFIGVAFTVLGLMRYDEFQGETIETRTKQGIESLLVQSDANMLDGMLMIQQIYPDYLEYELGMGHLEILTRPIPRAWWPGKPSGGWHQKLAARTGTDSFQTGISPSLYGSFFAEGGWIGVVICAFVHGWFLAKLMSWSRQFGSTLRVVLKGVVVASLFALIRGGDLPGIVAIICMSYWPLFIFIYFYRRFVAHATYDAALRQDRYLSETRLASKQR